jgi:PAS domain S-box-containing protein
MQQHAPSDEAPRDQAPKAPGARRRDAATADLAAARERFLAGDASPAGVRPVVLESWQRSRAYGVDPRLMRPQSPDTARLEAARAASRALLEAAEPYLAIMHETLAVERHLIALADADGRIVRMVTGPGLPTDGFAAANLFEGASWHERDIGCNGVGTCLATGSAVILIGPEHYQESYVGWTCIGAPLRGPDGAVVGALDLSVPNRASHLHTWGWTLSVARGIELSLVRPSAGGQAEAELALPELDEPLNAVRGALDLLGMQLGAAGTHARFLEEARGTLGAAEARLGATLRTLRRTEQQLRAALEAAREGEERLSRIADSGMVGLLYWQLDGSITWANDRFLEIVGYTRADLDDGRLDWKALTPPEWAHTDIAATEEVLATGRTTPWEKEFVRRDGSRVAVLLTAATFPGTAEQGLTLVHDITDRVESRRRIEEALEAARRAVAERESVLSIVSHDLRNPLNTIGMAAALLLEDVPAKKKQAQATIIRRCVDQMSRLIQDLLDASRIEGGGMGMAARACAPGELVVTALQLASPRAEDVGVTLRAEVEAVRPVRADCERVLQVFSNLINNALDHTAAGGTVTVRAEYGAAAGTGTALAAGQPGAKAAAAADGRERGDFVRFSVTDTGVGILPEDLPRVFDRFWQARSAGRAGAGLGLAIAKGIVEAHGGEIGAESTPGHGASFHFTLPLFRDG